MNNTENLATSVNSESASEEEITEALLAADIQAFKDRRDAMKLALMYAQDLVDMWPTITLRTLGKATQKISDLKEALKMMKTK